MQHLHDDFMGLSSFTRAGFAKDLPTPQEFGTYWNALSYQMILTCEKNKPGSSRYLIFEVFNEPIDPVFYGVTSYEDPKSPEGIQPDNSEFFLFYPHDYPLANGPGDAKDKSGYNRMNLDSGGGGEVCGDGCRSGADPLGRS